MCFLFLIALLGEVFHQSDWSGSDDVYGPVTSWGEDYYSSEDVIAGSVSVELAPENINLQENITSGEFGEICAVECDLNGDGLPDIAVVNVDLGLVTWWENHSAGNWSEHQISSSTGGARFCRAADFDLDGDLDLAVAASFDNEVILFTNSDGAGNNWIRSEICKSFPGARSLWEGDFNSDGETDLAGAATDGNTVAVWLNSGGNSWQMVELDPNFSGAWSVHSVDVDGDGDIDVAAAALAGGELAWWENSGDGINWQKHIITADYPAARSIRLFDGDNDGDIDAAGCSIGTDLVTVWENTDGTGDNWARYDIATGFTAAKSVSSCDVNRDGLEDILAASYSDGRLTWFRNPGSFSGSWEAADIAQPFSGASYVTIADMNQDGFSDALGVSYTGNGTAWWDLWGYREGRITSSLLDSGGYPLWETLEWNSTEPEGTDVSLQVRGGTDPSSPGDWSESIEVPGDISGLLPQGSRYIQYRVNLSGGNGVSAPSIHEIAFGCSFEAGISSDTGQLAVALQCISPSSNSIDVSLNIAESSEVTLIVYSSAGRVVETLSRGTLCQGNHQFRSDVLSPGLYLVSAESKLSTAFSKVIVLRP